MPANTIHIDVKLVPQDQVGYQLPNTLALLDSLVIITKSHNIVGVTVRWLDCVVCSKSA